MKNTTLQFDEFWQKLVNTNTEDLLFISEVFKSEWRQFFPTLSAWLVDLACPEVLSYWKQQTDQTASLINKLRDQWKDMEYPQVAWPSLTLAS